MKIYQTKLIESDLSPVMKLMEKINFNPDNDLKVIEEIEKMGIEEARPALGRLEKMQIRISMEFSSGSTSSLIILYGRISALITKLKKI